MKREDKTMDLKGRHFLTLKDFTPEEIIYLLDLAAELKEKTIVSGRGKLRDVMP